MFSSRVPSNLQPNRVTETLRRVRGTGRGLIDLTLTNPTHAGFEYPADLLSSLASPDALIYDPQPFGLVDARLAVAGDYARRGIDVAFDRVILTASSSEAYSVLFKSLCAPEGDAVLVPTPSYPLFEHLTELDGVRPLGYRLDYHGEWVVDLASVDDGWSDSVRALVAVSPNNPTGSVLSPIELTELSVRCAQRNAALIVDEVFADYALADPSPAPGPWPPAPCLTFRLGGLSKSAGLPQMKLGWFTVGGPDDLVCEALVRLELICDTYLSVGTPVQIAARSLIESGAGIRRQILERVRRNYNELFALAATHPEIQVLHIDAGWSAVIRVPAFVREEQLVIDLIERDGVLVYPGYFFDFQQESFLVVSLLPETQAFAEGVRRIVERAHG